MNNWTNCSAEPMKKSSAEVINIKRRQGRVSIQTQGISEEATDHTLTVAKGGWPTGPWDTMLVRILQLRLKESCFETFHGRTQAVLLWNLAKIDVTLSDILLTTEFFSLPHSVNSSSWNIHSVFKNNWQRTYDPVKLKATNSGQRLKHNKVRRYSTVHLTQGDMAFSWDCTSCVPYW